MTQLLDRRKLRTVHLVPLSAYDAAGRIAMDVQAAHSSRMFAAGIRVFMPGAGTSEFHSLSAAEILELVSATRQGCGPEALIFAPLGLQLEHAAEVGRQAREAGANGVMFMPFSHPYLSDAGVRDYYLEVLEQVQLPALIYKKSAVPSDRLLLELADHPCVIGIKYAENNLHDFRKVVIADRGRIEWLCGSAERFAPYYLLAGASGYTTGAGNLCPHLTLAMHAAFSAGEYAEGMRLQQMLLPIEDFRARDGDSYNISMLKYALRLKGIEVGPPRPPQRQLTAAEQIEIEALMQPILEAENELEQEFASIGLAGSV